MARGLSSSSAATGQQHSNGSSSNGQGESPLESLEAKYAALKEEYKLYRKKAMAALQSGGGAPSAGTPRNSGTSSSSAANADSALSSSSGSSSSTRGHRPHRADSFSAGSGDEAKMAYLRNLLLKYLGTDETVAKQHMERAMGAVFSFSPAELAAVKEQREKAAAAATGAWLAGVSSLLGGNKGS
jgi:GRIP domain